MPGADQERHLTFEAHEVHGLLSVAHLFPRSKGRIGVYVLHFADGHGYVGQSLDVVGRWATHKRRWGDIVRLEFARTSIADLDRIEQGQIRARQRQGMVLRNVTHALGNPEVESDLDWVVEPSDQLAWLNGETDLYEDDSARVGHPELRAAKGPNYTKLARRSDFDAVEFTLQVYTQTCVPRPRATELTFWALSAMPSTNKGVAPRLAALSINKMETLVIGHVKGDPTELWSFVNVSQSALAEQGDSVEAVLARTQTAFSTGEPKYEASGYDAIPFHFNHPVALALALVEQPSLLQAARALNLRLMRKGPTFQWRGHCFDLSDHVVRELEGDEDPDTTGEVDEDGSETSTVPESAPYGWVSDSGHPSRPTRLVHACRDCIERRRNPHTGIAVVARPASQDEGRRARQCKQCFTS